MGRPGMFSKDFTPEPYKFYAWNNQPKKWKDPGAAVRRKWKLAGLVASTWQPAPGAQVAVGIPEASPKGPIHDKLLPGLVDLEHGGPLCSWAHEWKAKQWNQALEHDWLVLRQLTHYVSATQDQVRKAVLYRAKARGLKALTWLDWPGCMVVAVVRPTFLGG